ncbi:MAG: hypothetical protein ROZ65_17795 [Pseudomonadaceae bacterium]|nr:hypothetical protein [Pseudomonadaceae bacterium]
MPLATIDITKCIQDHQDIGSNNDLSVMRSRIFFSMSINGKKIEDLYVDISQPYGTHYASELIEVGRPVGYDGPFAHQAFSNEIEAYYRKLVGEGASVISIGGGVDIRMSNNTFVVPYSFKIEIDNNSAGGW